MLVYYLMAVVDKEIKRSHENDQAARSSLAWALATNVQRSAEWCLAQNDSRSMGICHTAGTPILRQAFTATSPRSAPEGGGKPTSADSSEFKKMCTLGQQAVLLNQRHDISGWFNEVATTGIVHMGKPHIDLHYPYSYTVQIYDWSVCV